MMDLSSMDGSENGTTGGWRGMGGETRALWAGWNVEVGHEVRSLGCPGGEPRVAPNGTSGDTLGVRRHDRDVVPPASTSVTFGRAWSSRVERSSPGVESRAVAPASLEACDCDHAPVIPTAEHASRFLSRHTERFVAR